VSPEPGCSIFITRAEVAKLGVVGRDPAHAGIEFAEGQCAPLAAVAFVNHGHLARQRPFGVSRGSLA
jgi:hypothetical protein